MKNKKNSLLIVIGLLILAIGVIGVTYAFFNYTRTGNANILKVGRISFVSRQEETINLTNVFPIASSSVDTDTDNVGLLEIEIEGDTDYVNGIEYLVSVTNAQITSGNKTIPISLDIEVDDLGTESDNYFTARDSKNASIYKKLISDTFDGNQQILVGYIMPNSVTGTTEGVDGTITIKAYFDKDKIAISDTYVATGSSDYYGTTSEWVGDRVIFTTEEWNALQSSGISFQVKVEANEGIWVENITPVSCFTIEPFDFYDRNPNLNVNSCVNYFDFESEYLEQGETLEAFCEGTGTLGGISFQQMIGVIGMETLEELESNNFIVVSTESSIIDYDSTCGSDVVIPQNILFISGNSFSGKNLTSVKIPNSVMYIGWGAFSSNNLTNVTIPSSIELWPCNAFDDGVEITNNSNISCTEILGPTNPSEPLPDPTNPSEPIPVIDPPMQEG